MDRRAFVMGAFGLAIIGTGAGIGTLASKGTPPIGGSNSDSIVFTTVAATASDAAPGPLMYDGVDLVDCGSSYVARYNGADLFSADEIGATLVKLADGSRSIEGITRDAAATLGTTLDSADVASFFVTLGQAGFLQNTVLVNLVENPA